MQSAWRSDVDRYIEILHTLHLYATNYPELKEDKYLLKDTKILLSQLEGVNTEDARNIAIRHWNKLNEQRAANRQTKPAPDHGAGEGIDCDDDQDKGMDR